MNNTTDALLYAAAGGTVGFGIAKLTKLDTKKHWTLILVATGALIGGIIGNNQ